MFGYIKKESVIEIIEKEVGVCREAYCHYRDLAKAVSKHCKEEECWEKEARRYDELAQSYFERYLQTREILTQVRNM